MTDEQIDFLIKVIENSKEFKYKQISYYSDGERINVYSLDSDGEPSKSFFALGLIATLREFQAYFKIQNKRVELTIYNTSS